MSFTELAFMRCKTKDVDYLYAIFVYTAELHALCLIVVGYRTAQSSLSAEPSHYQEAYRGINRTGIPSQDSRG